MAIPDNKKKFSNRESKPQDKPGASLSPYTGLRVPPQSLDAEKALLGSLLLNSNAMYEVADSVRADSFYSAQNQKTFDAMLSLHAKGQAIDLVTVSNRLNEIDQLTSVGGSAYLSELVGS